MLIKRLLFVFATILTISSVKADQLLKTFTIKQVFSEGTNIAGFYPNEPLPECKFGLMYIDLSKESGKGIFSLVLSAKTSGHQVVRIDYTVNANETCYVTGLHIR